MAVSIGPRLLMPKANDMAEFMEQGPFVLLNKKSKIYYNINVKFKQILNAITQLLKSYLQPYSWVRLIMPVRHYGIPAFQCMTNS